MRPSPTQNRKRRKNSNPNIARFPPSVFSSKPGSSLRNKSSQKDESKFFVLRARGRELLLKMYDKSPEALIMLTMLKHKSKSGGRSKMIRIFIKE